MPQKILSVLVSLMLLVVPVAFAGGQTLGTGGSGPSVPVNEGPMLGGVEDLGVAGAACGLLILGIILVGGYIISQTGTCSAPSNSGSTFSQCMGTCQRQGHPESYCYDLCLNQIR